ncbi:MAG TPA: SPW repeat protein [Longimicrobium sp.]
MRIPTRVHGVLDYLMGALLIAAPWLLGFATGGPEQWVPVGVGAGAILYSLFTDYELGAVKRIQVPMHLLLDGIAGVVLIASPWVLGFDEKVWIPHVVAGALEVVTAFFTNTIPAYERRRAR